MLPCNVIVQELAPGQIEVAAIDPVASMAAIDTCTLGGGGHRPRAVGDSDRVIVREPGNASHVLAWTEEAEIQVLIAAPVQSINAFG